MDSTRPVPPPNGDPTRLALPELRIDYDVATLDETSVEQDPVRQLERWLAEAMARRVPEPHSMALSTVDSQGRPSSRNVLLRGLDRGLAAATFYTNRTSEKGRDLAAHPVACALFSWLGMQRQVRISGSVELIDDRESDEYFASRPRESQLGAWASPQSEVIPSRAALDEALAAATERFAGTSVPRPEYWGGYRLMIDTFEFWQGRTARLHDRIRYRRPDSTSEGTAWIVERLAP